MYFYTSGSLDAPQLQNTYGDFNAVINYLIDGGSEYKVVKIEPNVEKENTVRVYFENSVAPPFNPYQTIVVSGSEIPLYNTQMFIESVNSQYNYYVCYHSSFAGSLNVDETTNIKMKIRTSGIIRKFGGVADKRTVIKFKSGIEYRIDDRDVRPLMTPPITPDEYNEHWLKFTRICMSSNFDSLDSSNARMMPYNPDRPFLNFQPQGGKVGTQAYILWNRVDTYYYPSQSTSDAYTNTPWKIFCDEKSIFIIVCNPNNQSEKYVYAFGGFESYNQNILPGFLFFKSDSLYGESDYDSSSFPSSSYAYSPHSNFFYTYRENSNDYYNVYQYSMIYDGGDGAPVNLTKCPEYFFSGTYSGSNLDSGNSLAVNNNIYNGTYFSDTRWRSV